MEHATPRMRSELFLSSRQRLQNRGTVWTFRETTSKVGEGLGGGGDGRDWGA